MSTEAAERRDPHADLALCEAATPGPWEVAHWSEMAELIAMVVPQGRGDFEAVAGVMGETREEADRDAALIAVAREALPHYIKRAQAAEAKLTRLQTWLNERIDNWRHSAACYERDGDPEEALSCEADVELLQMVCGELNREPEEATPDA